MPGSSLWLLPPRGHPLEGQLQNAIRETAGAFGSVHGGFAPHVTLASGVGREIYESSPQAWLDSLPFPSSLTTRVVLQTLASDPVYVRKLYVRVEKLGVIPPARVAREVVTPSVSKTADEEENPAVEAWLEEEYSPHLSLLYHDCPVVGEEKIKEVEKLLEGNGVKLGEDAWHGGRVVLVETFKPIEEWVVIAERTL